MFGQLSSYFKKHLLTDVQQDFLRGTLVKFDGIICIQFQTRKTDRSLRNCCNFPYFRPNLINNKTDRYSGSKNLKFGIKVMSRVEFQFFIDSFL